VIGLLPYQRAALDAFEARKRPSVRRALKPRPIRGKSGAVIIDEYFR
jgi:hypothetical protein